MEEQSWATLQAEGAKQLSEVDCVPIEAITNVVGLDIHWVGEQEGVCVASVLPFPDVADAQAVHFVRWHKTVVPYRASFLGFREVDAFIEVMRDVCKAHRVDCVLVDGNGRLHPRRFGSACQFGLASGLPTVGVAKTLHRCCEGWTERKVKDTMNRLDLLELDLKTAEGEVLGRAVRKSVHSQSPVFVSVGNKISLNNACLVVRRQLRYNIPEAIRVADIHARSVANSA